MNNLAEKLTSSELFFEEADVVRISDNQIIVHAGGRPVRAQRAAMCLVEPRVGDRVLLGSSTRQAHVLGVLTRAHEGADRLSVDGDLELRASHGRVTVAAREDIELTAAGETSITSSRFNLRALEGSVFVGHLRALCSVITGETSKLSVVAEQLESLVERVRQRVKRSYRFVEEFDQLRARHIDHRAKQTVRVHAENTVITADKLAKVDGEQIHIG